MSRSRVALLTAALWGCSSEHPAPHDADDDGVADLIRDLPAPPDGGHEVRTPAYEIEPYAEVQLCYFGTLEWAEDRAITQQGSYQSLHGHHVVFFTTGLDPDAYPDGEVFDCTEGGDLNMSDMDPVFLQTEGADPETGGAVYALPDGMAAELPGGSRYVIQSHYINPTDHTIRVQDAIQFGFMPVEDVQTWAAPFSHVQTSHPIPPGAEHSISFSCDLDNDEDMHILFLGGHMHEWGTAFRTDLHRGGSGAGETIYDVPVWDAEYRDRPPINSYEDVPLTVAPGDTLSTHCTWFNTEDYVLDFPYEMCVTFGMAYPTKIPRICSADGAPTER